MDNLCLWSAVSLFLCVLRMSDLRATLLTVLPFVLFPYIRWISTERAGIRAYRAGRQHLLLPLYLPHFLYGLHFLIAGLMHGFVLHAIIGLLICITFCLIGWISLRPQAF